MKQLLIVISFINIVTACNDKHRLFEVSGKITNTSAKKVYLQYLVWGAAQPIVVDSMSLQKDGNFELSTAYGKEESMYELVFDTATSLLLINDNEKVFVNIDRNNFKKYIINGSTASSNLHEFLNNYSMVYPTMLATNQRFDTIANEKNIGDSIKTVVRLEKDRQLQKINTIITNAFKNTNSPALQYYLIAKAFATAPLQQIQQLNTVAIGQHPNHSGLAFLKSVIAKELAKETIKQLALKRQADSIKIKNDSLNKRIIDTTKNKY